MKKKDANFKKQIAKKEWVDKISYIFDKLLSFNKELVSEAKESIENLDKEQITEHVVKTKAWFQAEYTTVLESLKELNSQSSEITKKKLTDITWKLKDRLSELELQAKTLWLDLDKKYGRKKKLAELKKLYDSLEKKA